jgi:hypothetical protein
MDAKLMTYFILLFLWGVSEIFVGKWMFKAKPGNHIRNKYLKRTVLLSQLPFGGSWKRSVEKVDIPVLERYQKRIRIWWLTTFIPLVTMYVFFNLI